MFLTYVLLAVNVGLSLWAFENSDLRNKWMFNPHACKHQGQWYRLITHAFIHNDFMHLLFNMYVLYLFGQMVEVKFLELFGNKGYYYFILMYFGAMVFSSLPSLLKHSENPMYNSLGASGAVSGVVFAFIAINPSHGMGLLFIPIFIPAIFFGVLYLVAEYFLSKRGQTGIAHDAHLFGALFGFAFTLAINWQEFGMFIDNIKSIFA